MSTVVAPPDDYAHLPPGRRWPDQGKSVLRGEHGPGARLASAVLPGLALLTDALFAA